MTFSPFADCPGPLVTVPGHWNSPCALFSSLKLFLVQSVTQGWLVGWSSGGSMLGAVVGVGSGLRLDAIRSYDFLYEISASQSIP